MSLDGYERLEPVIGLALHGRLRTQTKLFSTAPAQAAREPAREEETPNARVQPLDLGHPGTLPVLNARAVELALRFGLATDCRVARRSSFARKQFARKHAAGGFSKGYQITQREAPLCYDGLVEMPAGSPKGDGQPLTRRVRIRRVHLEESAGKVLRDKDKICFDDSDGGAALIEIVTEPDLRAPHEAVLFMKKMRRLVRYLGICDGRAEGGSLRCDATLAMRRLGGDVLGPPVALKNLNAPGLLEHALRYEAVRQARCLEGGTPVRAETRGWDAEAGRTRPLREMRESETARDDHCCLPEPDLPPVVVDEALLKKVRASMPEGPEARRTRLVEDVGLPPRAAARLTEDRALADFYEDLVSQLYKLTGGGNTRRQAERAAHFLLHEGRRALADHTAPIDVLPITPRRAAKLVYLLLEEDLDAAAAAEVFAALLAGRDADPESIAREEDLIEESGREDLAPVVDAMLKRHSKNVHRYKSGKKSLMGFFVGEVRSAFDDDETLDSRLIRQMIEERLR